MSIHYAVSCFNFISRWMNCYLLYATEQHIHLFVFSVFTVHSSQSYNRWTVNGDERDMKWHFMLGWEKRMCDIIYHEQQVICLDISISSLFTVHCCWVDFVVMKCFEMLWNVIMATCCSIVQCMRHEPLYILMTIFRTQTHTYWAVVWSVEFEPSVCSIISKNFLISIWHISNWIVYT